MKVLIVSQHFWPENFRINDFALDLTKRGHQVTVLTGLPNYPKGRLYPGYSFWKGPFRENWQGIDIVRSPLVTRGSKKGWRLILNYLSFPVLASMIGLLRIPKTSVDRIFVHQTSPIFMGIPALVFKFFKKKPVYFWVLDLWPETLVSMKVLSKESRIYGWLSKFCHGIYRRCDRLLVPSQRICKELEEQGVPREKILYFPYWAEDIFALKDFDSDLEKKVTQLLPSGFNILFAGNLGQAQGLFHVIEGARLLPKDSDINFIFVGDGRCREELESLSRSYGLENRVFFLGSFPLEWMPVFYQKSQGLLVSLLKDPLFTMTIPSKLQGYMASGKPIVAVLDGEGADVVETSQCGIVVPPGDSSGLVRQVMGFRGASEEERDRMGKKGYEYYLQRFQKELAVHRFEGLP